MKNPNRDAQRRISNLWAVAAIRTREIDKNLSEQCARKCEAISQHRSFTASDIASIKEGLDDLSKTLRYFLSK